MSEWCESVVRHSVMEFHSVLSGAKSKVNSHSPFKHMSPSGRQDTAAARAVIPASAATAGPTVWHKRTLVSYVISVMAAAGTGGLIRERKDALICRRAGGLFSFLRLLPLVRLLLLSLRLRQPVLSSRCALIPSLPSLTVCAPCRCAGVSRCRCTTRPPVENERPWCALIRSAPHSTPTPPSPALALPPSPVAANQTARARRPPRRARAFGVCVRAPLCLRIHVRAKEWMSALWQGSESSSCSSAPPQQLTYRGRRVPLLIPTGAPPPPSLSFSPRAAEHVRIVWLRGSGGGEVIKPRDYRAPGRIISLCFFYSWEEETARQGAATDVGRNVTYWQFQLSKNSIFMFDVESKQPLHILSNPRAKSGSMWKSLPKMSLKMTFFRFLRPELSQKFWLQHRISFSTGKKKQNKKNL